MFNKSTRSYYFRLLVADHKGPLTWREARLMFKGATVTAIYCEKVRTGGWSH